MAEGLFRHYGSDYYNVYSAGTQKSVVHPLAVEAMSEIGIDISKHYSKDVDSLLSHSFDVVITVCDQAKEACPVFPGVKKQIHAGFEDPAGSSENGTKQLPKFRRVRDQLEAFVKDIVNSEKHDN